MKNDLNDLMARANFGLKKFRDLFREQGMVNQKTDERVTKLEKEVAELKDLVKQLAFNIVRGLEND